MLRPVLKHCTMSAHDKKRIYGRSSKPKLFVLAAVLATVTVVIVTAAASILSDSALVEAMVAVRYGDSKSFAQCFKVVVVVGDVDGADARMCGWERAFRAPFDAGEREAVQPAVEPLEVFEPADRDAPRSGCELEQVLELLLAKVAHGLPEPAHLLRLGGEPARVDGARLPVLNVDAGEPAHHIRELVAPDEVGELAQRLGRHGCVQPAQNHRRLPSDAPKHAPLAQLLHVAVLVLLRHRYRSPPGNEVDAGVAPFGRPIFARDAVVEHVCEIELEVRDVVIENVTHFVAVKLGIKLLGVLRDDWPRDAVREQEPAKERLQPYRDALLVQESESDYAAEHLIIREVRPWRRESGARARPQRRALVAQTQEILLRIGEGCADDAQPFTHDCRACAALAFEARLHPARPNVRAAHTPPFFKLRPKLR
mmetsp:Transcript_5157/g.17996  ORF Transcript_5157/g.17996 Transcript_5157/m.17996 type:complete len:425 (+) Transcript_5157:1326-2600(+)